MRLAPDTEFMPMSFVAKIGDSALEKWRFNRTVAAVILGVLSMSVQPRFWPRTVRTLLARQIVFTGIEALRLTLLVALVAGVAVVAQAQVLLGQSEMLGPVLVAVIIREIGPLMVNLLVIGRSGTAIATELANMRVRRETDVLDAQGLDPMAYLIMPRVIGMVLSVFCLALVFIAVSLVSGYVFSLLLGVAPTDPEQFTTSVFAAIAPKDVANLFAKTILPGLLIGTICSLEGMTVAGSVTDVPRAATRGVVKSIAAVLVVSAIVSVLTYA